MDASTGVNGGVHISGKGMISWLEIGHGRVMRRFISLLVASRNRKGLSQVRPNTGRGNTQWASTSMTVRIRATEFVQSDHGERSTRSVTMTAASSASCSRYGSRWPSRATCSTCLTPISFARSATSAAPSNKKRWCR